jgi:hypothetical protein
LEARKVEEAKAVTALERAADATGESPAAMTAERLSTLLALGSAVEGKVVEISRKELHVNLRREVGLAHDSVIGALAGVDLFVAVIALDLVRKQYLDRIYEG